LDLAGRGLEAANKLLEVEKKRVNATQFYESLGLILVDVIEPVVMPPVRPLGMPGASGPTFPLKGASGPMQGASGAVQDAPLIPTKPGLTEDSSGST
jgi:hypothetical protein